LEAQSDAARQREEALAAELEENRRRQGETVDLLELAKRFQAPSFVDYHAYLRWHHLALTEGQLRILKSNKIDPIVVRDRGHAAISLMASSNSRNASRPPRSSSATCVISATLIPSAPQSPNAKPVAG